MNLSHGEFRALVAKAFRGAGYTWGLTEEASFSAGWLAERWPNAGELVVELLTAVDGLPTKGLMPDQNWSSGTGPLCPICVGTSIADQAGCQDLLIGPTLAPVLIAPFLAATLERAGNEASTRGASKQGAGDDGYLMTWQGGSCTIGRGTMVLTGHWQAAAEPVEISRQSTQQTASPARSRVELAEATFVALDRFAHRVYAPATEASRAGAGAGTTDND